MLVQWKKKERKVFKMQLTRIALPVKVIRWVAVAFQVKPGLFASWAVSEWYMVVGNFVKEVNLLLLQKQRSSNGVDRCVTPSFVEEATILVEGVEVVQVCVGS